MLPSFTTSILKQAPHRSRRSGMLFCARKSIKAICRDLRVSRKVVRKVLRSEATEFRYKCDAQPLPRIGPWQEVLDQLLKANEAQILREPLTLSWIFEALLGQG